MRKGDILESQEDKERWATLGDYINVTLSSEEGDPEIRH